MAWSSLAMRGGRAVRRDPAGAAWRGASLLGVAAARRGAGRPGLARHGPARPGEPTTNRSIQKAWLAFAVAYLIYLQLPTGFRKQTDLYKFVFKQLHVQIASKITDLFEVTTSLDQCYLPLTFLRGE